MSANKIDEHLAQTFLVKFSSPNHLKQWVNLFLGLDFPDSWVDPDSNSSPINWLYESYKLYEKNQGHLSPDTIVISSRESYKTLSESVFAIIMMVHFKATIAHMAAIVPQASAAQKYIESFILKIKPYLEYHQIGLDSQNSKEISIKFNEGTVHEQIAYMKIIVCTVQGANCISPNSVVWTSNGQKKLAKYVNPGDELLTFDYMNKQEVFVKVGNVSYTKKKCREIKFSDGSNLITSKDHRIFTDSGWKCVGNLRLGDKVTSSNADIINTVDNESLDVDRDPMQMIYGSLLGDASVLLTPQKRSARFSVSHTEDSKEYVMLKANLLQKIGLRVKISERTNKLSPNLQVRCISQSCDLMKNIYHEIYKPVKTVNKEWLDRLTWEGVAYWFMDDMRGNSYKIGSNKDHCYELSTCGFSRQENELILSWFRSKGLDCKIDKVSNSSEKVYDIIKFTLDSSRKLTEYIEKWFIPCMSYKLVPTTQLLYAESIDGDEFVKNDNKGFVTSTKMFRNFLDNTRKGRKWRKDLLSHLSTEVIEIKEIGIRKVIDIHIDTDRHFLRSFYVNSKKLVHNSSHTNIFCVSGKTRILIENPNKNSKRKRIHINASKLYKLIKQGYDIKAVSYNEASGVIEFRKIVAAFDNGISDNLVDVSMGDGSKTTVTLDHKYRTIDGYKPIGDLQNLNVLKLLRVPINRQSGHQNIIQNLPQIIYKESFFDEFDQLVLGGLLGDMGCYKSKDYRQRLDGSQSLKKYGTPYISLQHGLNQSEYCNWKKSIIERTVPLFDKKTAKSGYTGKRLVGFYSGHSPVFDKYYQTRSSMVGIERLEALGLAVWFMDDGSACRSGMSISTHSFSYENQLKLQYLLKNKFDIEVRIAETSKKGKKLFYLRGDVENAYKLYKIIEKYIHPSMLYKFKGITDISIKTCIECKAPFLSSQLGTNTKHCGNVICQSLRVKTLHSVSVQNIVKAKYNRHVYDFTVEGNHNYFADNFLVHNCIDEIDTIRSKEQIRAYNEAQFIPGLFNGQNPITIKTSTLKFPGGLFTKEMDKATKKGYNIWRWNIIDITEKCLPTRYKPELPQETVYVAKNLPLKTLTEQEFASLNAKEHDQYDQMTVMGGCAKCPLLPVCRSRLAHRSDYDRGGLWKTIDFTIAQFDKTDPDLAEAQLLCRKPSAQGMVYPRFLDKPDGTANSYTIEQAYTVFIGENAPKHCSIEDLVNELLKRGIKFYAGVDWGFRHAFAISVSCIMPNGQWWLIDAYSVPGLEFEQMIDLAQSVRDIYKPVKWFADTAQPMFIKAFKKRKMPCAEFKKDVLGGIEAVRGQILNAKSLRRLKVIRHDRTELLFKMFAEHCFLLDTLGNLTKEPDDGEYADIADTVRYAAQNLFKPKNLQQNMGNVPKVGPAEPERKYTDWMTQKTRELTEGSAGLKGKTSDGQIIWDFGSESDDDE